MTIKKPMLIMNLQLFAEMGVDTGVESVEGVADLGNSEVSTGATETTPEVIATPTEDKAEVAFAKRLAAERAKLEETYSPYKTVLQEAAESYGFKSVEEYLEAYNQSKAQQEEQRQLEELQRQAQELNASPELLQRLKAAEDKIAENEAEKERVKAEYERTQWESQIKGQVSEVLELAKKENVNITEEQLIKSMMEEGISDPKKAYKLMKPEIDIEAVKKSAVEEYFVNLKKGNRPVEGGGTSPVLITQQPKTFEDARKGAAEMLRASNIFK